MEVKAKIGAYNKDTRSVPVTFTGGGVTHKRDVNAVHDDAGAYDKAATKERVDQVGNGVAHKIAMGVITNPEPVDLPEPIPVTETPAE